ncbi:hypothetical protein CFBP6626_25450 (plasmid) [Agrobacterium tumefaciens]|nr:hypothetical protein CFBP6626_25450 [Agrobacterium tumefaciens]
MRPFISLVPLASGRRQGKLRRALAPTVGVDLQISRLPGRALAPFALRGRRKRSRKLREG